MNVWTGSKAVAFANLRERYNRGWRFSKGKAVLWKLLIQFAVALWAYTLYQEYMADAGLFERVPVMVFYLILNAVFAALITAPGQMFQRNQHTLPLLTSAPPLSVLVGQVLTDVPQRLWYALLLAIPFSVGLPVSVAVAFIPVMTLVGGTAAILTLLTINLLLVLWVRLIPKGLTVFMVLSVMGQLALFGILGWLALNTDLANVDMFRLMLPLAKAALLGWAVVVGAMLAWFLAKTDSFNRWYLNGWLTMLEGKKEKTSRNVSTWPRLLSGKVGAILAKDLTLLKHNPIAKTRIGLWAATVVIVGVVLQTGWFVDFMSRWSWFPAELDMWLVVLMVLVPGFFTFGEMLAVLFQLDRYKRSLYVISSITPRQLVTAKLSLGALLYVLPSVAVAVLYSLLVGLTAMETLLAAAYTALLALAGTCLTLGVAAFDVRSEEGDRSLKHDAAAEQLPQTIFSMVATMCGTLVYAIGLWIGEFTPQAAGSDLLVWTVLLAVAVAVLWLGSVSIRKRLFEPA